MEERTNELSLKDYKKRSFKYSLDKLVIEHELEEPDSFFKFYALSENKVRQLEHDNLYFSHPNQFNDLLDGNPQLWDFSKMELSEYKELYTAVRIMYGLKEFDELYDFKVQNSYRRAIENNFLEIKYLLSLQNSYKTGLFSLSECYDSNLMWAHYANESGFVVEYLKDNLLDSISTKNNLKGPFIFPINYQKELIPIDIQKDKTYLIKCQKKCNLEFPQPIAYLYSVKSMDWGYEKEWRIMVQKEKMGYVKNPLDIISTDSLRNKILSQEISNTDIFENNRLINITKDSVSKIILGPYFFSNRFFSNHCIRDSIQLYCFEGCKESELAKRLLKVLLQKYPDKIYQLDIDTRTLKRKLMYKIEIHRLHESFVEINRIDLN